MKTLNMFFLISDKHHVYILPLRNENNAVEMWYNYFARLYPTFKEWKLQESCCFVIYSFGLYPTFKEWKPSRPSVIFLDEIKFISYL